MGGATADALAGLAGWQAFMYELEKAKASGRDSIEIATTVAETMIDHYNEAVTQVNERHDALSAQIVELERAYIGIRALG